MIRHVLPKEYSNVHRHCSMESGWKPQRALNLPKCLFCNTQKLIYQMAIGFIRIWQQINTLVFFYDMHETKFWNKTHQQTFTFFFSFWVHELICYGVPQYIFSTVVSATRKRESNQSVFRVYLGLITPPWQPTASTLFQGTGNQSANNVLNDFSKSEERGRFTNIYSAWIKNAKHAHTVSN